MGVGIADVQFVVTFARPLLRQVGARTIDGLGDVREVLLGVEAVNDLNSVGKVLVGEVPDPPGSIAGHRLQGLALLHEHG